MTDQAYPSSSARRGARRTLPRRVALGLQMSIVVSLLASSIAPTPLYAHYAAEWGFGATMTTVIFAAYAIAVLTALLIVGRLSDHVGRRPVLLAAVGVQPLIMVLFATAGSVEVLLLARVLQGLSTGAAIGAVGAGLVDLSPSSGATINAVAAPLGTAVGCLLAGVLVGLGPAPDQTVFEVLFVVFVLQLVGLSMMGETVSRAPGALESLRPSFAVPPAVRPALVAAVPALIAAWALAGFYGSLGPLVLVRATGSHSILVGTLGLGSMAFFGSMAVLAVRDVAASTTMRIGTALLAIGVALTLPAIAAALPVLFFVGSSIAGAGFGCALNGAMRSVIPLAEPHERAGVVSIIFVTSYLAMGLPAIAAGLALSATHNVVATATGFGLVTITLALVAFWLERRR